MGGVKTALEPSSKVGDFSMWFNIQAHPWSRFHSFFAVFTRRYFFFFIRQGRWSDSRYLPCCHFVVWVSRQAYRFSCTRALKTFTFECFQNDKHFFPSLWIVELHWKSNFIIVFFCLQVFLLLVRIYNDIEQFPFSFPNENKNRGVIDFNPFLAFHTRKFVSRFKIIN